MFNYHMARQPRGKSERSDWFFLGRDFAIRTISMETVIHCVSSVFFVFESLQINSNFATKTTKGKPVNTLILRREPT